MPILADEPRPQQSPPRILVVEDDPFVRDVLDIYLRGEGYEVTLAADGTEMRSVLAVSPIHLVIMDLRLPGEDGFALTRYLREQYQVGIIILSTRHEIMDRVVGLECGADDYLTKPFEERELLARIRSVLRRTGALSGAAAAPRGQLQAGAKLSFHGCSLDQDAGLFRSRDGMEVPLTGNECRLLGHLVRHAGKVQTREDLMAAVLQRAWDPLDRSIDVLVTRIRHKIESDPKRPVMIKTVRGAGYIFSPEAAFSDNAA